MKLSIAQSALNAKLNTAQQLIGRSGFGFMAFDAFGDNLTIKACNNEGNLSMTVQCDILEEGATCIHSAKLTDLVRLLHGEIDIKTNNNGRVTVKDSRKDSFKIVTLDRNVFQELPEPASKGLFSIPSTILKQAIEAVAFAMPHRDDSRFTMNGAKMVLDLDGLSLTATDGQRIANVRFTLPEEPLDDLDLLVSDRALNSIAKLCSYGENIRLAHDASRIYFSAGDVRYAVAKLAGSFPDTEKAAALIDDSYKTIKVKREDFHNAFKKASLISDNLSVGLLIHNQTLNIKVENEDGAADISLAIEGDLEIELLLNAKYVLEFLETIIGENLLIDIKAPTTLVQFRPEQKGCSAKYLLAPMRK